MLRPTPGSTAGRTDMKRRKFEQSEAGATALEYGLLLAGIASVIIGAVATVGTHVRDMFAITWPW